jgi:hypothetical protein
MSQFDSNMLASGSVDTYRQHGISVRVFAGVGMASSLPVQIPIYL